MAKGGGGSWKVAYADFVTAMMAFFLVMWIGAQDVKVRQSVANYFVDPSGVSKTPKSGGQFDEVSPGPVPNNTAVNGGAGTRTPSGQPPNPATAAVMQWIKENPDRLEYWKGQAQQCRETAASQAGANQAKPPDEVARDLFSKMLSTAMAADLPPQTPEVYRRIVFASLVGVDWDQVAKDIMNT
jgi:flagellar motor protein MotB